MALKDLNQLQKDRVIVVRACDKGAGIMLLDFEDYLRACYNHLTAQLTPGKPYYSPVNALDVEKANQNIKDVLKEGLDAKIITQAENNEMNPDDKDVSRFYCNFKVHKKHEYKKAPPERPIISQSGSICENIGAYVEHQIRHIAKKHDSYLEDTPDFLREIVKINNGPKLGVNTVLVTMDAIGLFTNIIHEEGMEEMEYKLNEREKKNVPTDFIMKLMKLILY